MTACEAAEMKQLKQAVEKLKRYLESSGSYLFSST